MATLKALGAVPFCTTNSHRVLHPEKKDRTPGGSSAGGGEACLAALGGSPIGVGGGGILEAASFCGVSALKPTAGRMFQRGVRKRTGSGVSFSNYNLFCSICYAVR